MPLFQIKQILDFWSTDIWNNKFVFISIKFVIIYYNSNGKLMH